MPEIISIKQGRGHPKNFTNWYKIKTEEVILKFRVQESIFMNFFLKDRKQKESENFNPCLHQLQANRTADWY